MGSVAGSAGASRVGLLAGAGLPGPAPPSRATRPPRCSTKRSRVGKLQARVADNSKPSASWSRSRSSTPEYRIQAEGAERQVGGHFVVVDSQDRSQLRRDVAAKQAKPSFGSGSEQRFAQAAPGGRLHRSGDGPGKAGAVRVQAGPGVRVDSEHKAVRGARGQRREHFGESLAWVDRREPWEAERLTDARTGEGTK